MNDNQIAEILKALEHFDGTYKRAAVDAALEHREEITPHLIRILEQVLADPETYAAKPDYYGHIYALVLLGHFRETRAHRVIVELFSLPPDLPEQLFGDLITETLPIVLLRTCGGSVELIKSLALNRNADEYCQGSALRALVYAVAEGLVPREEIVAFFRSLFTSDAADPESRFWDLLASSVCDLYPEELMDVIEKAFQDGLISPWFIDYESFVETLQGGRERALNRIRAQIRQNSPDDVHRYMSWWACFKRETPLVSRSVPRADKPQRRRASTPNTGSKKKRRKVKPAASKKRKKKKKRR